MKYLREAEDFLYGEISIPLKIPKENMEELITARVNNSKKGDCGDMSVLVNENVKHNKFGYGKIVDEQFCRIDIDFGSSIGIKSFLYPEAFENFLKLENELLQKECMALITEKKEAKAKEAEAKRLEQEKLEEEKRLEKADVLKKKREATKGQRKTKTRAANMKKSNDIVEEDET